MKITIGIKRNISNIFEVVIFLFVLFSGCTTTDAAQKNSSESSTSTNVSQQEEESLPAGCPSNSSKITVCMALYAPATCTAQAYNGKDLSSSMSVEGSNICKARQALISAACTQKLEPSKLSKIKCQLKQK